MPFDSTQVDTDPTVLALIRAKRRIEDKRNWCGYGPSADSGQMCALVAVGDNYIAWGFLDDSAMCLFGTNTITVNDTLGHAAVMRVYDLAIEMARERARVTG